MKATFYDACDLEIESYTDVETIKIDPPFGIQLITSWGALITVNRQSYHHCITKLEGVELIDETESEEEE